jgi:segregation and condensation protein B
MSLDVLIEALLFYKATPQNKSKLCKYFEISTDDLGVAIAELRQRHQGGAITIAETDNEIQLVTSPIVTDFIEDLRKEEISTDIGKAGAETLAIILYREPISRAEIDRIRGVNSNFILRNLQVRGLINRESTPGNGYQFRITTKLLQHLGVTNKRDLPEFAKILDALDSFNEAVHDK